MKETEGIFERKESKFLIPPSRVADFSFLWEQNKERLCLEEERYNNSHHRTVYYFPQNANGFYPGFGVRYREYSIGSFDTVPVGEGSFGCYEIKSQMIRVGTKER